MHTCPRCGSAVLGASTVCPSCRQPLYAEPLGTESPTRLPPIDQQADSLPLDFILPEVTGVWNAVGQGLKLFFRNLRALAPIVLLIWLPIELIQQYLLFAAGRQEDFALAFRLSMWEEAIFGTLLAPAMTYANFAYLREGRHVGPSEAYRWGVRKWGRTFGARVRSGIYIVIGTILLVVPGIYFWTLYGLTDEAVAIDNNKVGALERSEDTTEGRRMRFLGVGVVTMFLAFVGFVVVSLPLDFFDAWWASAISATAGSMCFALFSCTFTICYLDGKRRILELPATTSQTK